MEHTIAYLRAFGFTVTVNGKSAIVSREFDDVVMRNDISPLLDAHDWQRIDRVTQINHRTADTFDRVKIEFK